MEEQIVFIDKIAGSSLAEGAVSLYRLSLLSSHPERLPLLQLLDKTAPIECDVVHQKSKPAKKWLVLIFVPVLVPDGLLPHTEGGMIACRL